MSNSMVVKYSLFTDFEIDLFKLGKYYHAYQKLGSHAIELNGVWGYYFAVWAPNAKTVGVEGDFNHWQAQQHQLYKRQDGSGVWEGFIPNFEKGWLYKYNIQTKEGAQLSKGDPYASYWETPPNTASISWDLAYEWQDEQWLKQRKNKQTKAQPYSVYEVHLGSWKKKKDDYTQSLNYRELAKELVNYVKEMAYTHVELLPVMEHPYYPSWGYQITGYYAPTSRFGTPQDFMYLVDQFHQAGIGVLLDWVPSHFTTDAHGLGKFDGTSLYEHSDTRKGFHPDWGSYIFDYSRHEVRSFLISNALYWIEHFHIDGFRVDAVASMLYLDYSRNEGQWIPNKYGGNENLDAISFLQEFNTTLENEYPDVIRIAEESTAWDGVSRSVQEGGLGFNQKWMMGWMHDSLKYMLEQAIHRPFHHHTLTFSIVYAFSERFMLPLSHDEVVHGKGPLLDKMSGQGLERFANLRLLYGYMYTHPGSKLLFMGSEFGQSKEWNIESGLQWELLQKTEHLGIQEWVKALNKLYKTNKALYELQFVSQGFEWINHSDHQKSIISYVRKATDKNDFFVVVCNFSTKSYENFSLGVTQAGSYTEIINSNQKLYGGNDLYLNPQAIISEEQEWDEKDHRISIQLAALSICILAYSKNSAGAKD